MYMNILCHFNSYKNEKSEMNQVACLISNRSSSNKEPKVLNYSWLIFSIYILYFFSYWVKYWTKLNLSFFIERLAKLVKQFYSYIFGLILFQILVSKSSTTKPIILERKRVTNLVLLGFIAIFMDNCRHWTDKVSTIICVHYISYKMCVR